ncbi:mcfG [Symbiodinium natans]|uniref:McfG protein n=1 Tax=Symbiodinium natans TaxID=878477 RepID=A0A812LSI8_9DINO|nr:mcfG [Symbiodinium natans]
MDFISGWTGGAFGTLLVHPLDTIRTRQAVHGLGLLPTLRGILQREGFASLYSGVFSPCLTSGVWKGVTMTAHYQTQQLLSKYRGLPSAQDLSVLDVAVCASVAGMAGGMVVAPAELIKSRTQICVEGTSNPYQKELKQVAALMKPGAWTKAFRGAPLIVLRDGPGTFVYLGVYEYAKRRLESLSWPAWSKTALAASVAGPSGWVAIYPIEVLRIRFQGELGWQSYTEVCQHIYKQHGLPGFFRGMGTCLIRSSFQISCTLVIFESMRAWR